MPSDSSVYRRFLVEARQAHARFTRVTATQLETAYTELVQELVAIVRSGPTTLSRVRAAMMIRDLRRTLAQYGLNTERIITRSIRQTVGNALRGHSKAMAALESRSGLAVGHSFARVPRDVFEALIEKREFAKGAGYRGFSEMFRSIQGAHLRRAADAIDDTIMKAVGAGKDSRTLAGEIANLLTPSTEGQQLLATARGIGATTIERTATSLGTSRAVVRQVQSTIRRTELIAIQELNNAFHEADAMATRRSPVIGAVKWRLSGAHPQADACDILAMANAYGKGNGVYPVNAIPALPHPRCLCTTEKVVLPPNKWNDPNARLFASAGKQPRTIGPDYAGQLLNRVDSTVNYTPNFLMRQATIANTVIGDAYDLAL